VFIQHVLTAVGIGRLGGRHLCGDKQQLLTLSYINFEIYAKAYPQSKHDFMNLINPTGHVMHHQFDIQQLYALPTLYLCVLYLSENKQLLVPLTA